jgi:diguanylate cyclase (GGDEF)-like protein
MSAPTSPLRSAAGTSFGVGVLLSIALAIVPGRVFDQRNAKALRNETAAFQGVLYSEVAAQLEEFKELSIRWVASDPLLAIQNKPIFGSAPTRVPKLLFSGFVAFESPFPLERGEAPQAMLAAYIERGPKGYVMTNNFVAQNLAATERKLGLEPIPSDIDKPKFINLKIDPLELAQMIPTVAADSSVGKTADLWAFAFPVANRGWLVAPIAGEGFTKLLATSQRRDSLDVAMYAGKLETDPLVGHLSMMKTTSSLRRTMVTREEFGQPFTFVVSADENFVTGSTPNPVATFLIGILLTCLTAFAFRSRQQKQNARVLMDERDAANILARTDSLTNLPNRLAITESLEALNENTHKSFAAVLLCDLDRFKIVNDARGHDAGDALLIEVSRRLEAVVASAGGQTASDAFRPQNAMVARLGGDEFLIMLPSTTAEEAVDVGHQIIERLRTPFSIGTDQIVIGASVGMVLVEPGQSTDRSSMLRDADLAMYAAKREGGNCLHVVTDELRASGGGQLDLELELRSAFGTGQLVAWYQPLVDCQEEIRALEALVRWQHPTKGLLNPGAFLPAAKRAGLLAEISTDVLSQVCRDVSRWNRMRAEESLPPIIVHVNCVEEQLMDGSFAGVVASYLAATEMNPAHLLLEVSEETAMDRLPKGLPTIQALRAMGVRFSLDDFGFGNASLTMVRQLGGVAEIKIDKSIVDGLVGQSGPNAADLAVIDAVRKFATDQDIVLVAEGIELVEQRDLLIAHGIDLMQGYLFHRPQPPEKTAELLLTRQEELAPSV